MNTHNSHTLNSNTSEESESAETNSPEQVHTAKVAIIGAGNLGVAIGRGLASKMGASSIWLCRRHLSKIEYLADAGFQLSNRLTEVASQVTHLILCVQPHQISDVLRELNPVLDAKKHVIISTLTGVDMAKIEPLLPGAFPVIRAMPNTAIAIGQSMTCICGNEASKPYIGQVEDWFGTLGESMVIDEEHMKAATVLAASGIAFFLRYIRAATQGGIELGFEAEEALKIASATAKGAAALLMEQGTHPEHEIDKVTTPKGCTIAGLNEMEYQGLSSAVIQGLKKSFDKISAIGES